MKVIKTRSQQKNKRGNAIITEPVLPLKNDEASSLLAKPPAHFYKYKSIDEDHPEYFSHIFSDNELFFNTVNDFNDPFDCKFQVKLAGSKRERDQYGNYLLEKHAPHLKKKERLSLVHKESMKSGDPNFEKMVNDEFRHSIETFGICCLSAVEHNVLMWSHYADAHHGFCLKFSSDLHVVNGKGNKRRIDPFRVMYSSSHPVVYPMHRGLAEVAKAVFTKAKAWDYEKEWRIISPSGRGPHPFPRECLTGIIFGCRMKDKHKEMIRLWCKDWDPTITYYQAQQSKDQYKLNIVEIP